MILLYTDTARNSLQPLMEEVEDMLEKEGVQVDDIGIKLDEMFRELLQEAHNTLNWKSYVGPRQTIGHTTLPREKNKEYKEICRECSEYKKAISKTRRTDGESWRTTDDFKRMWQRYTETHKWCSQVLTAQEWRTCLQEMLRDTARRGKEMLKA